MSWSDGVATADPHRHQRDRRQERHGRPSRSTPTPSRTSAGANGTISPVSPSVNHGADRSFTITPDTGYHVATLGVDGSPVTPATAYTFTNVTAAHTISATFAINTYTLTYTAGPERHDTGTTPPDGRPRWQRHRGHRRSRAPATTSCRWSDGVTTAARTDTNVTANKSVTRHVRHQHLHAHLHRRSRRHDTGTTRQTVAHGGSGTSVTAKPTTGYHFVQLVGRGHDRRPHRHQRDLRTRV